MPGRLRIEIEASHPIGLPTGIQLQGAFLSLVQKADPTLGQELHDGGTPPLYHCAALPGQRRDQLWLCGGFLRDGDLERLLSGFLHAAPQHISFGPASFRVARLLAADREDRETGAVPLPLLGKEGQSARGVRLHFHTPTVFRAPSQGVDGPRPVRAWPSPERVLDSLGRRLNRAREAAGQAPADLSWTAQAALHLSEVAGRGEIVRAPSDARPIHGFIGEVRWNLAPRMPAPLRELLQQALALAPYCGVGSRGTQGCGHVTLRWLADTAEMRQS